MEDHFATALGSISNKTFYQSEIEKLFERGMGRIAFQITAAELCEHYVQNLKINVYAHDSDMRIFAAFHNNQLIGMIDSEPTDIKFAKTDTRAMGMGDVFINSNYRGCGLGAALLAFANNRIKESGIDRVFVTHGTINPTARGFWDKYFANYAYTMTRWINPEMLGMIKAF